ncbi:MAG: HesA/MoeB/ThiF family protein [Prevotella sp.]|nr:HesA/MoeB/ThiF family protein [Prevotella sp.]
MTSANCRYQRQIIMPEIGERGQALLAKSKVLLVGVGGLGSPIATYLAGAGVGTLGLVDNDVVSLTNLHRQVLYTESEVGQPKVESAKRRLMAQNGDIHIETYQCMLTADNAEDIISHYDIVVDGTDNFAARFAISDACQSQNKPYVYGAINGLDGQVSVLCNGKATYRTLINEDDARSMPHPGKAVVGVTPAVVGSVEAGQVLQLICGYGTPLIDRLWTIDLRTMQSYIISLNS